MKLIKRLERLKSEIDKTIVDIKKNEKQILVKELIEECKIFDEGYKEYCDEVDEVNKLEPGTTYSNEDGPRYFKEEEIWHRISFMLRRLEELDKK